MTQRIFVSGPSNVFLTVNRLAMADSIIYATVLQHNALLWTADQHFDGLPSVRYFDKTQG